MIFESWKETGQYFQYKNYPIFYQDSEEGDQVLLCIHGFPTASWDWNGLWPELTKGFRVVTLDMIGFGLSAKPKDYNYSILDQADLCESFLKHLNISSFHILAHDYGDTVAQELLARHEERKINQVNVLEILSICLLNGGLFPESHKPRPIQKLLNSPVGSIISHLLNESAFNKSFSAVFGKETKPSPEELSEFWQLIDHEKGQYISHKIIRYINERKQYRERWVMPLQKTSVPVRLINGVDDPISGIHMAERYMEIIPNPDVVLLDNVAHYPQVEAPERVFAAFTEFHNAQKLK